MATPPRYAIIGSRGYPSTYGGFETLVRRLAPYLADHGDRVTVYGRRRGSAIQNGGDGRVDVVNTPGVNHKSLSTLTHGLTATAHAAVRDVDAALVLNVANGFFLPALRARGVPTAVNVDGIEWERDKWSGLGKATFRAGARATARFASTIVADSRAIGGYWQRTFDRDSIFIPYGADLVPTTEPHAPTRIDGISPGGYVLVVARLVPENNVGLLLDALDLLAWRYPTVVVGSAVGTSDIERRLLRLQQSQPNLHWLGHVHDQDLLLELWQHCGIYVHGHSVGGTNPALLQALGAGSPTLVFGSVYNKEVVGPEWPSYGADAAELAHLLDQLMQDEDWRRDAAANGRALIRDRYSWPAVLAAYRATLQGLH